MTTTGRSTGPRSTSALGYASVASGEPLDGPGIEGQVEAIERACERLNLRLVDIARDHQADGAEDADQPGLLRLLDRIDSGEASCLIVSDLERLTRRTAQLETILERLEKGRVRLVALDVGLDSATEAGSRAIGLGGGGRRPRRRRPPRCARSATPAPRRARARERETWPSSGLPSSATALRTGSRWSRSYASASPRMARPRSRRPVVPDRADRGRRRVLSCRDGAAAPEPLGHGARHHRPVARGRQGPPHSPRTRPGHRGTGCPHDRPRARLGRGDGRPPVRTHAQAPRVHARQAPLGGRCEADGRRSASGSRACAPTA